MKDESSETGAAATTQPGAKTTRDWLVLPDTADSRTLAILAFFFGVAVMLAYRPWSQVEVGDPAVYDYIAQSILRGQLPYRDIVDIKGPGGGYLSALAMALGRSAGLRDVIASRLMNVVLAGLLSAVTYLVAEAYLKDRFVAVLAFVIPLMPERFATMLISGTQPKLPMILFGMTTLLLIAKNRPLWAGVCSMLSCLCWQPGLLFTGSAFLIFSRYLTSWRDRRALKVLVGASIPLLVVLVYFYWKGALSDLWAWSITYNYSVFGPEAKAGAGDAIHKLWIFIVRVFRPEPGALGNSLADHIEFAFESFAGLATLSMVPCSLIGLLLFGLDRVRAKFTNPIQSPDLFPDALFIAPAVYLGFCLINFQASADLIPFFPFIGIFAGLFFIKAGAFLPSLGRIEKMRSPLAREKLIPGLALVLILVVILGHTVTYKIGDWTLQSQVREFRAVSDLLGPDDKIYVHGTVEILVLLNRPNLNPYVLLDWDADNFAGARFPGGWSAIVDGMEAQSPKIVAISRLRTVTHRADIERWVDEHYDRLALSRYDRIFVRKSQ
jgi:DolP-mannose mannosyltransferase